MRLLQHGVCLLLGGSLRRESRFGQRSRNRPVGYLRHGVRDRRVRRLALTRRVRPSPLSFPVPGEEATVGVTRAARPHASSHPDFHRRSWSSTRSTTRTYCHERVADCHRRLGLSPTPEHDLLAVQHATVDLTSHLAWARCSSRGRGGSLGARVPARRRGERAPRGGRASAASRSRRGCPARRRSPNRRRTRWRPPRRRVRSCRARCRRRPGSTRRGRSRRAGRVPR